jgi:hypothetical protein
MMGASFIIVNELVPFNVPMCLYSYLIRRTLLSKSCPMHDFLLELGYLQSFERLWILIDFTNLPMDPQIGIESPFHVHGNRRFLWDTIGILDTPMT